MASSASATASSQSPPPPPPQRLIECKICSEKYNISTRRIIKCGFCDFDACMSCYKRYILDQPTAARCMNTSCRKTFTLQFMTNSFTKIFINTEYKEHKSKILLETERALLPLAQLEVERLNEADHIRNSIIKPLLAEQKAIEERLITAVNQVNELLNTKKRSEHTKTKFIRKCTFAECRGFLSNKWKCGLCENYTCNKCLEVRSRDPDAEHTCDPATLETAKLILSDTKPCPSCSEGIYKIEGCDQMFCTGCNTPFSWRTGEIITREQPHNPHYFEWLRKQGTAETGVAERDPNEVRCGREIDYRFIQDINSVTERFVKKVITLNELCNTAITPPISPAPTPTNVLATINTQPNVPPVTPVPPVINNELALFGARPNNYQQFEEGVLNRIARLNRFERFERFMDERQQQPTVTELEKAIKNINDIIQTKNNENAILDAIDNGMVIYIEKIDDIQQCLKNLQRLMGNILQNLNHLREQNIQTNGRTQIRDNSKYRIQFLRNQITEEQFKSTIQKNNKDDTKKMEYYNIISMFVSANTDLIYRIYDILLKNKKIKHTFEIILNVANNINDIFIEMNTLREYVNEQLVNISKMFSSKLYHIDIDIKLQ